MLAFDKAPGEKLAEDRFTIDRKAEGSVRRYDDFGRLHVRVSNVSKSNICPYYGREIPRSEELGLEPNRIYRLYRDPEEMRKSTPTWNSVPLLNRHLSHSAATPQKDSVVGTTGTDAEFVAPYMTNSLVVWEQDAIILIETDEQRELSSSYRYVADMTPGTIDGEDYDGVMRNIVGNHVALVPEGRAGSDVLVGDSKPNFKKGRPMIKTNATLRSRTAIMAQGALVAYLAPRLAADAQIDLTPVLEGVNSKNFDKSQSAILRKLGLAMDGKLAADATLDEAGEVLASVGGAKDSEVDDRVDTSTAKDADPDDDDVADDEDKDEKADDSDEEDKKADDAEGDDKTDPDAGQVKADDEEKDEKVDKPAMDAAIRKAKNDTRREVLADIQAMDSARAAVRPHIGEVANARSATEIYRLALDSAIAAGADIDLDGVPSAAYPAMVKMLPLPGSRDRRPDRLAADAASSKGFADRFPAAANVRHV